MESLFTLKNVQTLFLQVKRWAETHLLVWGNLLQAAVAAAAVLAGLLVGKWIRRFLAGHINGRIPGNGYLASIVNALVQQIPLAFAALFLWLSEIAFVHYELNTFILRLALSLLTAWIVIRLAASLILSRFWSRVVTAAAWTIAALNILGILNPTLMLLQDIGFSVGRVRLTALSLIKAAIVLVVLLRLGNLLSGYLERRLQSISEITPSTHVLLSKVIKIAVFVAVFVVALNSVGIDLTVLAVFSGAVGVGIGFGLQKVVANLISGIILLLDKSIKPGDVVEMGGVFGWITDLRGRYVSVVTRDGKEYLIPNEDLITQQVINWSFSNRKIRIRVPVGISYNADPHKAIELIVDAVRGMDRVLTDPAPRCLLKGFGDNSVDLELRFWIEDPQNGVANIRSRVLLNIWDVLTENGIEIPFPQRDVHFDAASPVPVRMVENPSEG
ncbi:MAG: mechanosensitive ion channel [Desulfobacterales bacterium]|jgi:small-conductance mechanosensitive channel